MSTKSTGLASPDPEDNEPDDELVQPTVNRSFWFTKFQKPLIESIIEMIKNAFDWQATIVNFITNEARTTFHYVDNGRGMNSDNRRAFISVGESTAGGDQSGTFGTGANYLIFTHSSNVRLVTAPEETPDRVFIMEFTPEELADAYSGAGGIRVRRVEKTVKTWPHEHRFGTDIIYTLKNPGAGSIFRGAKLAQKLSDRLDNVMVDGGMVLVDGDQLPGKRFAQGSRLYSADGRVLGVSPAMGRFNLEFYRPAGTAKDLQAQDLLMTDRSIGEVSFRKAFVDMLTDEQREMIPPLFLEKEVCGLITAGFLHDHVDESRSRYTVGVADDERVNELLRLLNHVEADVATHLGIKLRHLDSIETHDGKEEVDELIERLQKRYNPEGEVPKGYNANGDSDEDDHSKDRRNRRNRPPSPRMPRLLIDREEFALDEKIVARLVVPDGDPTDFHFNTDHACGKVETLEAGMVTLIADTLGKAILTATNPMNGEQVKGEYEVVEVRKFHLSARGPVGIRVGAPFTEHAINADLLAGKVVWELVEGRGELVVAARGLSARFTPNRAGRATMLAYDSDNPEIRDTADIRVLPGTSGELPFRIRDQFFTVYKQQANNVREYGKAATIKPFGDGEIHRMIINPLSPDYQVALRIGMLPEVLAMAMAVEFAKHFCITWEDAEASDLPSIMLEVQNEAAVIFSEMLEG